MTQRKRRIITDILFVCAVAAAAVATGYLLRSKGVDLFREDREPIHLHNNMTYLHDGLMRHIPFTQTMVGCNNPEWPAHETTLNNEGFRDERLAPDKPLIGIFGDSFVFGYCLSDEEKIDRYLEDELKKRGVDLPAFNFGISGYNLHSTLTLANRMVDAYDIRTAIVYFLADDDMLPCDISCQKAMKKADPGKYEEFKKEGLVEYVERHHANYRELVAHDFAPLLEEMVVATKLHRRTRLVFYLFNSTAVRENIIPVLERHNLEYVIDEVDCDGNRDACYVPRDGHPTTLKNRGIARTLAEKLAGD